MSALNFSVLFEVLFSFQREEFPIIYVGFAIFQPIRCLSFDYVRVFGIRRSCHNLYLLSVRKWLTQTGMTMWRLWPTRCVKYEAYELFAYVCFFIPLLHLSRTLPSQVPVPYVTVLILKYFLCRNLVELHIRSHHFFVNFGFFYCYLLRERRFVSVVVTYSCSVGSLSSWIQRFRHLSNRK